MCGFLGARVPFQNVHYCLGIRISRPGGSPFSLGEEQTFQNAHYSLGKKWSHPGGDCQGLARDLRGQVLWRREIGIYRTEMKREDEKREKR